jgi:uncharacterized membrane protein
VEERILRDVATVSTHKKKVRATVMQESTSVYVSVPMIAGAVPRLYLEL